MQVRARSGARGRNWRRLDHKENKVAGAVACLIPTVTRVQWVTATRAAPGYHGAGGIPHHRLACRIKPRWGYLRLRSHRRRKTQ